jgi:hypothetical protein
MPTKEQVDEVDVRLERLPRKSLASLLQKMCVSAASTQKATTSAFACT